MNSKAELFSDICDINKRVKSHYKSKFVEYDKLDHKEIVEGFDKLKNIKTTYYIYQLLDELEKTQLEIESLKENNRTVYRKKHQNEINSLKNKIQKLADEREDWRDIKSIFAKYIIANHGDSSYEELIDNKLKNINKSFYGV